MDNQVRETLRLYDLPDEVLLQLMSCLNNMSLLNMTRVCKRFKRIAKETFTLKYNGATEEEYYKLNIYSKNLIEQHKQYRPFFSMFGENMIAIEFNFNESDFMAKDHWIIDCIQRYCTSLAKIHINCGKKIDLTGIILWLPKPTLTHLHLNFCSVFNCSWVEHQYPKLIYLNASELIIPKRKFDEFIDNNRQLQELHLLGESLDINLLHSISGKLNDLKSLSISSFEPPKFLPGPGIVNLPKLEKFVLELDVDCDEHPDDYASIFQSITRGCKNIKELLFRGIEYYISWDDKLINAVCDFSQLTTLQLCVWGMESEDIKRIILNIENLSSLRLQSVEMDEIEDVFEIISICLFAKKLKNLEISFSLGNKIIIQNELKLDYLTRIADITERNAGMTITLRTLGSNYYEVISTQGEVRFRGEVRILLKERFALVYWSGYDPIYNRTKLTLPDLSDKCMEEIISYLDVNAQSALYNTCTQTQKAVEDYISKTVFEVPAWSTDIDRDAFQCLAPSIRYMIIKHELSLEHWELINWHCTNLIELNITHSQKDDIHWMNISLPNLKKLTFSKSSAIDFKGLRSFDCPSLSHLEISRFEIQKTTINSARVFYLGNSFRYLTVLKFDGYNEGVVKFVKGLDEHICKQLKVLSLGTIRTLSDGTFTSNKEHLMKIINAIARCRNLNILQLIIPDIEEMDFCFLFENCTKLTDFTVCCTYEYESRKMFQCIKKNCKNIKSIQMVIHDSKNRTFQHSFLREIHGLFPDVSITVPIFGIYFTIPVTPITIQQLVKNKSL